MEKIKTALCAIAALTTALCFTACEKKQPMPGKPVEQPAKKQEYKSQPKPAKQNTTSQSK